jgi:hypothetical protein
LAGRGHLASGPTVGEGSRLAGNRVSHSAEQMRSWRHRGTAN